MGQKITETKKKYWRKKKSATPTRGAHEKTGTVGGIWLRAASIRAIKTVAQTAIATIGTSALLSDVNWIAVISASLLSGILSMLTSVAGLPEVEQEINYLEEEEYDDADNS